MCDAFLGRSRGFDHVWVSAKGQSNGRFELSMELCKVCFLRTSDIYVRWIATLFVMSMSEMQLPVSGMICVEFRSPLDVRTGMTYHAKVLSGYGEMVS